MFSLTYLTSGLGRTSEPTSTHICHSCHRPAVSADSLDHQGYCRSCLDRPILPSKYRPKYPNFNGFSPEGLYFGLEIETGPFSFDVPMVEQEARSAQIDGICYAKDDISIAADYRISEGFELVSHPCSYRWLTQDNPIWTVLCRLIDRGFEGDRTNSCGMHVHMSRAAFHGAAHLYRFARFFYARENYEFLYEFSERSSSELQDWAKTSVPTYNDQDCLYAWCDDHTMIRDRYYAINLSNEHTVECRLWQSTLDRDKILVRIEFLLALYYMTAYHFTDDPISHFDLARYVSDNPEQFPHFTLHLADLYRSEQEVA